MSRGGGWRIKKGVSFVTEAKPKERTVLNVSVSITDTDVFEHALAILGVIYRNTKDEDLKKYIEEELDRALKGEWDIEGVLNPRIDMYRCLNCGLERVYEFVGRDYPERCVECNGALEET